MHYEPKQKQKLFSIYATTLSLWWRERIHGRVLKVRGGGGGGGGWESMDFQRFCGILSVSVLILLVCITSSVKAGDIVHGDDLAPKKPGCENDFVLV